MKNFVKNILKRIKDGSSLPCYIISYDPIILISFWHDLYKNSEAIFKTLPKEKNIHFLFQLGWHRETEERASELSQQVNELKTTYANAKYTFLTNSEKEEQLLKQNGLTAILCHQNAFEDVKFFPLYKCPKEFDAIYTARITPFKRHQLASKIKSLRLIGDYHDFESQYVNETFAVLKQADWSRRVHFTSMYKELSRARVGLCLSEEEGAMFASIEYLLCGLPVVSTPNLGGRDLFFDPNFSRTVEPNPDAVASAVEELIKLNIDPEAIRNKTIETMNLHRDIFMGIVQGIFDEENSGKNFREMWEEVYEHKFAIRTAMPWFGKAKKRRLKNQKF